MHVVSDVRQAVFEPLLQTTPSGEGLGNCCCTRPAGQHQEFVLTSTVIWQLRQLQWRTMQPDNLTLR
jgi:hypothetical protein